MEPESLLPHSQQPTTCPYSEPDQSSPCPPSSLSEDQFKYYPSIYAWVFQVVNFPQVSSPKSYMHLVSTPYMLHTPPISVILI